MSRNKNETVGFEVGIICCSLSRCWCGIQQHVEETCFNNTAHSCDYMHHVNRDKSQIIYELTTGAAGQLCFIFSVMHMSNLASLVIFMSLCFDLTHCIFNFSVLMQHWVKTAFHLFFLSINPSVALQFSKELMNNDNILVLLKIKILKNTTFKNICVQH